jgi:hypothetical protein
MAKKPKRVSYKLPQYRDTRGRFARHPLKVAASAVKRGRLDNENWIKIASGYGFNEQQSWRLYKRIHEHYVLPKIRDEKGRFIRHPLKDAAESFYNGEIEQEDWESLADEYGLEERELWSIYDRLAG